MDLENWKKEFRAEFCQADVNGFAKIEEVIGRFSALSPEAFEPITVTKKLLTLKTRLRLTK